MQAVYYTVMSSDTLEGLDGRTIFVGLLGKLSRHEENSVIQEKTPWP